MEKDLASRPTDRADAPYRTFGDDLPASGPTILAAAKILLEVTPPDPARVGSVAEELAALDSWVSANCGPQGFTWPEYWEYRATIESLANNH
jgi:hypothetical protein